MRIKNNNCKCLCKNSSVQVRYELKSDQKNKWKENSQKKLGQQDLCTAGNKQSLQHHIINKF